MTKDKREKLCAEISDIARQIAATSQVAWRSVDESEQEANAQNLVYARNFLKTIVRPVDS